MSRRIVAVEYWQPNGTLKRIIPRTSRIFGIRFSVDPRFVEVEYYGKPDSRTLIPIDRICLLEVRDEPG